MRSSVQTKDVPGIDINKKQVLKRKGANTYILTDGKDRGQTRSGKLFSGTIIADDEFRDIGTYEVHWNIKDFELFTGVITINTEHE